MIENIRRNIFSIVCSFLLIVGIVLVVAELTPIQVLRNFVITTDKTSYNSGGTVLIISHATKLRKAYGLVNRTIECDNGRDKVVDYQINSSLANGGTGKSNKPSTIVLPTNIANTPATCRLVVAVKYNVLTWGRLHLRTITQNAVSNDFIVQ